MNIKKIAERAGFIFIIFPVYLLCMVLNIVFWLFGIIWCPIYYIITGKDPLVVEFAIFYNIGEFIWNWYTKNTDICFI